MALTIQVITGQKYNRFTVVKEIFLNKPGRFIECLCDCGNIKIIDFKNLRYGKSKSCGCYNLEQIKNRSITHGMTDKRIYRIYRNILHRCNDINSINYKSYGGKGIVCTWNNFEEFYKDMGETYQDGLSIDRIDVNGNYCKENCRWASSTTQARNKTTNITYKGKCIAEWCEELGLNYKTVYSRINQYGWSYEKALQLI